MLSHPRGYSQPVVIPDAQQLISDLPIVLRLALHDNKTSVFEDPLNRFTGGSFPRSHDECSGGAKAQTGDDLGFITVDWVMASMVHAIIADLVFFAITMSSYVHTTVVVSIQHYVIEPNSFPITRVDCLRRERTGVFNQSEGILNSILDFLNYYRIRVVHPDRLTRILDGQLWCCGVGSDRSTLSYSPTIYFQIWVIPYADRVSPECQCLDCLQKDTNMSRAVRVRVSIGQRSLRQSDLADSTHQLREALR
jgi:hypothetical protein